MSAYTIWTIIGFAGQALFFSRFLVQWVASEIKGESVIPILFWYFSLGGGLILFSYAVYIGSPVFIVGQTAGVFVYTRNLILIRRKRLKEEAEREDGKLGNTSI